jgi:hypothetical protein
LSFARALAALRKRDTFLSISQPIYFFLASLRATYSSA